MPNAPLHECSYPGCTTLTDGRRCPEHQPRKPEYSTLYATARWRRESKRFLDWHPLCECDECRSLGKNMILAATVVDHRVPHRGDERKFWDQSNWVAMSKPHHDRKTGTEVAERERERRGVEG